MTRYCTELADGITTIDTGYLRPGFDASHLLIDNGLAAFVDVGTAHAVPRLLQALRDKDLSREDVAYVMVTHVHLDHAGGAGVLLRHLPNARLVVHPRGARHMIDPAKLIAGASAVYGEERFAALYGEIAPVPAARVIEAGDGFELDFQNRPLLFLDTPGHARHHYCIVDARSAGIFAGDTFGLSYREFDTVRGPFIFPTTSPVQFEPEALHVSIDRLLGYRPERMYLTHYGCVEEVTRLAADLHRLLDAMVDLARAVAESKVGSGGARHVALVAGLEDILIDALAAHGCALSRARTLELLSLDVELNAQGLAVWLEREAGR